MEPMLRFKADDGSEFPNWEEKTLGELANLFTGKSFTSELSESGRYVVMDMGSVSSDGLIIDSKLTDSNRDLLRKGDLIMPKDDIGGGLIIGKTAYIPCDKKYVCGDHVYRLCFDNDIDALFMHYEINSSRTQKRLRRKVTGSAQLGLNSKSVLYEIVSVPSLPEQHKIADLLSAVDDVIAAQEAEVAAWEKRKKGVMQKLFSQEVRFKADDGSDFPDWEEKTLGDICMYERQRSEGANFVGTENMLKDFGGVTFDNSNADGLGTLYHPGDTLMSNIRPYLKKAWLADRKGTCSTDVLVFHPTSVEPGYLYWLIASDAFVRYVMSAAKGSKMPRGDKKHIMEMPLLLPNKDEQCKIDDCLSSLNDVIIKAKNELAKWQELKKGLLQQMFV